MYFESLMDLGKKLHSQLARKVLHQQYPVLSTNYTLLLLLREEMETEQILYF